MLTPTRQLVALLASDLTQELLAACRDGERSEAELRASTGTSHATLTARLQLMQALGLLECRRGSAPRGRHPQVWAVTNDDVVRRFCAHADAFVLELRQALTAEAADAIRDRARQDLSTLDEPADEPRGDA